MRVTTLELTKPKLNINVTEGTNQTFHFSLLNSILFKYFLKFVFVCLKRGRGGGVLTNSISETSLLCALNFLLTVTSISCFVFLQFTTDLNKEISFGIF